MRWTGTVCAKCRVLHSLQNRVTHRRGRVSGDHRITSRNALKSVCVYKKGDGSTSTVNQGRVHRVNSASGEICSGWEDRSERRVSTSFLCWEHFDHVERSRAYTEELGIQRGGRYSYIGAIGIMRDGGRT